MNRIVISDLDGTIADIEHRRHWLNERRHLEMTPEDRWRRFFAECPPRPASPAGDSHFEGSL